MGDDVFVVWDIEDTAADLYLKLGISLARALAVRQHKEQVEQSADYQAIDQAILHIEKAVHGFEDLDTWAKTAYKSNEKILDKIARMRKEIEKQIGILREHTGGIGQAETQ